MEQIGIWGTVQEYQKAIHYAEEPLGKIHVNIRIGRTKIDIKQPASCFCLPPSFLSLDSLKNTPGEQCSYIPATMGSSDGPING